jgi:hypothetical protein
MDELTRDDEELRRLAIERIRKRSEFKAHVLAYVLVNAFLVAIWAVTGANFFWPIFPILGWGIGVAFNAWDVYRRPFPTEGQIQHEIETLREPHA